MIIVITRWESGWFSFNQGQITEFSLWDQICKAYKVDRIIFIPKLMRSTLEQYDRIEEALDRVVGKKVFLERKNRAEEIGRKPIYLKDFHHPDDAVYIFGNSSTDNSRWAMDGDIILSIKTPSNVDMFGSTVLGIVLYDRQVKANDGR